MPMTRRGRTRRGLWGPMLVAVLVLVYLLVGSRLRDALGLPGDGAAPARGAGLRVVTWNLRNFPDPTQDPTRLRARLHGLGADLIAVVSGVFDAPDPPAAARAYRTCFDQVRPVARG